METVKFHKNYPAGTVLLSNLVSLGIYGIGFFILFKLGWIYAIVYIFYILILEYRIIRYHCTKCYYWGKVCGFGRGKVSAWLFKQGDNSTFCLTDMTWKDMIPDILLSLIPIVIGIILLITGFDIILLSALMILVLLTTMGNGYVRGTLTCKHCKQKDLGCPADKLFNPPSQSVTTE
jgi:hypothetical protein